MPIFVLAVVNYKIFTVSKNLLVAVGNFGGNLRFGHKYCRVGIMTKIIVIAVAVCALVFGAYCLGRSHAKTEVITKRVEVIKYVENKKAAIYSKPNLERTALLELMREGKL